MIREQCKAKLKGQDQWISGYYIEHHTRQVCPMGGDKLKDDEIKHLIATDSFADWNMPKNVELREIDVKTLCEPVELKDVECKTLYLNDRVEFINGKTGYIVFECGAFGIAFDKPIDYDEIQRIMDNDTNCCSNTYRGVMNDHFISLWEIYWNFNCEEDILSPVKVIGNRFDKEE